MTRTRYIITQINDHFVVTDAQSSRLKVVNATGQMATIPADAEFFALSLQDAERLADTLNG